MTLVSYEPIAYFKSSHQQAYEAPRQGVLAENSRGEVKLEKKFNEACVEDLKGFDRVWLIYDFHENSQWRPKVRTPRFSETKKSVFSTRSPYRPNSIGMSCVKLDKVTEGVLYVSEHDLLDGTPILDIKPYLPYADSFPDVKTGWVKNEKPYDVSFTENIHGKILWLEEKTHLDFRQILKNQLSFEPTNSKAKRVKKKDDHFVFSIRTWRFEFILKEEEITIISVYSGYSEEEMSLGEDPYGDKRIHRDFTKV